MRATIRTDQPGMKATVATAATRSPTAAMQILTVGTGMKAMTRTARPGMKAMTRTARPDMKVMTRTVGLDTKVMTPMARPGTRATTPTAALAMKATTPTARATRATKIRTDRVMTTPQDMRATTIHTATTR